MGRKQRGGVSYLRSSLESLGLKSEREAGQLRGGGLR
jgi:hypothetical protein